MTGDRHDQGFFSHRDCCVCRRRPHRSSRICPAGRSQRAAGARQGRPAGYPPGRPRLLAAGLAEFRSFLPARRRQEDRGSGKPGWSPPTARRKALPSFTCSKSALVEIPDSDSAATFRRRLAIRSRPSRRLDAIRAVRLAVAGAPPVTAVAASSHFTRLASALPVAATHRRAWRRLWRHRHQPALRAEGSRQGGRPRRAGRA